MVEGTPSSGASASPSSSLLLRVQAQDREAWQKLVRLYWRLVYSWCRRRGVPEQDAEDIRQLVFQAVAEKISTFRRDRPGDSFLGWLFGITRNKICDYYRQRPHEVTGRPLDKVPAEESPSDLPELDRDVIRLLRAAVELIRPEFTEQTWRAFWLVTIEEQPVADVAAALGMSRNAVYIAKSRVLHRLQDFRDVICGGGPWA
jgi:RNA polymerase sigma-70 factor (ECF subfamily)